MASNQASINSRLRKVENDVVKGVSLTGKTSKEDKFERFENWLRENGAQFEMVGSCVYCLWFPTVNYILMKQVIPFEQLHHII